MSQSLESVVRCLVGGIEGVTAVSVNGRIASGKAAVDEDVDVDVAVMVSAVVRRRVPARILGL